MGAESPFMHDGGRSQSPRHQNNDSLASAEEDTSRTLNPIDLKLARKNTFKKRYDMGELAGANLVINRKSLN